MYNTLMATVGGSLGNGKTTASFFPNYFFSFLLKDLFVLGAVLGLFWYFSKMTDKEMIFSRRTYKGFFYLILVALAYVTLNYWNYPVVFFGFSYGADGITVFFYALAIAGVFTLLSRRFHPLTAMFATIFVTYLASIMFELPTNIYMWLQYAPYSAFQFEFAIANIALCATIIPALYIFKSHWTKMKYLVPIMTVISIIDVFLVGNTSAIVGVVGHFTKDEGYWMIGRTLTVIGLTLTFFETKMKEIKT